MNEQDTRRAVGMDEARTLRAEHGDEPPLGECVAVLRGKSWGKKVNLTCYFECEQTGARFILSVFRGRDRRYTDRAGQVDFSERDISDSRFRLTIAKPPRARFPALVSAQALDHSALNGRLGR